MVRTTARKRDVGGEVLGAADDAGRQRGREPQALLPVELGVLKAREPHEGVQDG
jgi:hypothetical protein